MSMSEDQLRWERLEDELRRVADVASEIGGEAHDAASIALGAVANAIAKATDHPAQPTDAVPELPEWIVTSPNKYGGVPYWRITLPNGSHTYFASNILPEEFGRIAEACRILAARRRAKEIPPLA
jgi:hypothetical protein